jgi:photosystem II cytochrome c550
MLKKLILIVFATVFFAWQFSMGAAQALQLNEDIRTVKLNQQGETIVLSNQKASLGAKLFRDTCAQCHIQGKTKTNPNVSLSDEALAGAEPMRDNLVSLVDYMEHPTSYDGEEDLSLLHMNTERTDLWPEMRNLTEEDLEAIAGHILIQINFDPKWGKLSLIDN